MAKIFLSPSTQDFNSYIIGGNEEYYMNLIADSMEKYLKLSSIQYERNNPTLTARAAVEKANKGDYDLYLALHSNASPEKMKGILKGSDVYYYPFSPKGKRAANIIADNLKKIYPNPILVNTKTTTTLIEVVDSKAPAVLVEIAYHDNRDDANWIINNIDNIAKNLSMSVANFLGVPFYSSEPYKGKVFTPNSALRIRSAPSLNSRIIGYLRNGEIVDIIEKVNDFYKIRKNNIIGYASSNFIKIL